MTEMEAIRIRIEIFKAVQNLAPHDAAVMIVDALVVFLAAGGWPRDMTLDWVTDAVATHPEWDAKTMDKILKRGN